MKSKQLAILIALAAVLAAAVFVLNKQNKEAWTDTRSGAGDRLVAGDINAVARVTIHSSTGTVNLVRKEDAWTVEERGAYPANFERVGGLVRKLWDLKAIQNDKVGPSQFARFDLVEPTEAGGAGTRVDFKDKDGKAVGALLIGKKFMKKSDIGVAEAGEFPAGRWLMVPGGSTVSLVSDTLDDVDPKAEGWLKKDFIKIDGPSSVTLAGTTDTQKWKLTRDTAGTDWKLDGATEAEKLDQAKASQIGSVFAFGAFADVLNPDAKAEETGLDKPVTATFQTFDGFTYVLKVGKENAGNQPVSVEVSAQLAKERTPGKDEKPEDKTKLDEEFKTKLKTLEDKLAAEKKFEGRPFLIAKATLDQLIKDRASFLAEKNPNPAPGAPGAGMPMPPFPGANSPSAVSPPMSVTTPPISLPPRPKTPPPTPQNPERKPITVTTPPISVPPMPQPPKPDAKPAAPDPATPKPDAVPPAPKKSGIIGAEGSPSAPSPAKEPAQPAPPAGEKPPPGK